LDTIWGRGKGRPQKPGTTEKGKKADNKRTYENFRGVNQTEARMTTKMGLGDQRRPPVKSQLRGNCTTPPKGKKKDDRQGTKTTGIT